MDLLVINSNEELSYFRENTQDTYWIGLSDLEKEGKPVILIFNIFEFNIWLFFTLYSTYLELNGGGGEICPFGLDPTSYQKRCYFFD